MSDNTEKTGGGRLGSEGDDTTDSEKERLQQMRRILVEQQQQLLSHYNHSIRNSGDNGKQQPISLCYSRYMICLMICLTKLVKR